MNYYSFLYLWNLIVKKKKKFKTDLITSFILLLIDLALGFTYLDNPIAKVCLQKHFFVSILAIFSSGVKLDKKCKLWICFVSIKNQIFQNPLHSNCIAIRTNCGPNFSSPYLHSCPRIPQNGPNLVPPENWGYFAGTVKNDK